MNIASALLAQDSNSFFQWIEPENEISFPNIGLKLTNMAKGFRLGSFEIRWYGVIICLGLVLCMVLAIRRTKSYGIKTDDLLDYILFGIPVSIICARIYYVVFRFDYYKEHPGEIIKIWEGGIAIYGAVIGIVLVALVGTLIKKKNFLHLLDFAVPYLILGQAIGRWGNFINQEAYGSKTNSLLGMTGNLIAKECGEGVLVHPTFLYESLWCFATFAFLIIFRMKLQKNAGEITSLYMILYGLERAVVEGLRTDSLMIGNTIRVSQWLSVVLVIVGIALFIDTRRRGRPIADLIAKYKKEMAGEPAGEEEKPEEPEAEPEEARSSLSDVADILAEEEAKAAAMEESGEGGAEASETAEQEPEAETETETEDAEQDKV